MNAAAIEMEISFDRLMDRYWEWLKDLHNSNVAGERVSYPRYFGVGRDGRSDDGHVQYQPDVVLITLQEPPCLGEGTADDDWEYETNWDGGTSRNELWDSYQSAINDGLLTEERADD